MRETINLKGTLAEARELSEKFDLYMNEKELQELANDLDPDAPRPLANEFGLVYSHYLAAIERDNVALNGAVVDGVPLDRADAELVAFTLRDHGTSLAECKPTDLAKAMREIPALKDLEEPGPEWEMTWDYL